LPAVVPETQVAGGAATARTAATGAWTVAGLLLAAAVVSGFTILRGGAPFDEGVVLQAARRVADGQVPYRDFLWPYGPAQPYVLGAWFDLSGTSLLPWRIVRVTCDAAVAVVVFLLVRRRAPLPLALLGWLAAACAMAQPTSANPFPPALLCALLAVGVASRTQPARASAPLAGILVAATAAWRLDFGLYAGAAALAALLAGAHGPRERRNRAATLVATAAGAWALLHLPFLVTAGPADLYDALVGDSLNGRDHWTLPFPLPWDGPAKDVLENAVPTLLVVGLAGVVAVMATRLREWRVEPREAGLAVLAGGALLYLLSRPDEFHTAPLLVSLAALIPMVAARVRLSGARALPAALAAILALLAVDGLSHRARALVDPPELVAIDVPVADGAKAPPGEARAVEWMVATVQRLVPPAGAVYTVTRRSDLVRFNQPLVYVLTERRNATDRDFGLLAEPSAQRRTVRQLRRSRPRAIVRWTDPISVVREPNLRGEPSGSRLLDEWVSANYRRYGARGPYEVLVPRG
jgi:hypothetical protein